MSEQKQNKCKHKIDAETSFMLYRIYATKAIKPLKQTGKTQNKQNPSKQGLLIFPEKSHQFVSVLLVVQRQALPRTMK